MDAGQINELLHPKLNEIRHYQIRLSASPSDAEDILKDETPFSLKSSR